MPGMRNPAPGHGRGPANAQPVLRVASPRRAPPCAPSPHTGSRTSGCVLLPPLLGPGPAWQFGGASSLPHRHLCLAKARGGAGSGGFSLSRCDSAPGGEAGLEGTDLSAPFLCLLSCQRLPRGAVGKPPALGRVPASSAPFCGGRGGRHPLLRSGWKLLFRVRIPTSRPFLLQRD